MNRPMLVASADGQPRHSPQGLAVGWNPQDARRSYFGWIVTIVGQVALVACLSVLTAEAQGREQSISTDRPETSEFAECFQPVLQALAGQTTEFSLSAALSGPIDGRSQSIQLRLNRWDLEAFDLEADHADFAAHIHRRPTWTALALPKHRTVFLGHGPISGPDHLELEAIVLRLVGRGTALSTYAPMVVSGDGKILGTGLKTLLQLSAGQETDSFIAAGGTRLARVPTAADQWEYQIRHESWSADLQVTAPGPATRLDEFQSAAWNDWTVVELSREELERTLSRGARRALEVLLPSPTLINPRQTNAKTPHGELRWVDGQRLVLLHGTPQQIGWAHGRLLRTQSMACVDSVLHAFGTVQTVVTGRWFRHDLEEAYERLRPHIPEDHLVETRAMADSLGIPQDTMEVLNVFPELFHCSGFAVFGDATLDGTLYHGRVLDYMTTIGLQDAATTFVIKVDGKIPFATIGYAGFTGSVSGMNAAQISLGEMGGRGEGQWDGVPMATLMRRALEECDTLQKVIDLWTDNPRTCEYYYVFADGKDRSAVGVAATPESIEFVYPGQGHALLGEGIPDTVLMSAGDRLNTLRQRVQEHYGQIDIDRAQWLMSRPVAMESNLHNVLFVPEQDLFRVANASHRGPAANQPYVEYNLKALVLEIESRSQPVGAD